MTALPQAAEAAIAAVLVLSVLRAFFGPPPEHADRVAATGWMVAGVVLLGTVLVAGSDAQPRELLTAGAVMAVCVAGWWLRARDNGSGGDDEPDESPLDWDEFDRLREWWPSGPRPQEPIVR